jgi:DNA-binding transcriptional MerR regulator
MLGSGLGLLCAVRREQVAAMSGVSVRTLHFYDEAGLLKPAYTGVNGYRFYEEPSNFRMAARPRRTSPSVTSS